MNKYKIYVEGTFFASCYGWYEARRLMRKYERMYKGQRVWKEKVLDY